MQQYTYDNKELEIIAPKFGIIGSILSYKKGKAIGIMITSSNDKCDRNGIKFINCDGLEMSYEDLNMMTDAINNDYEYKSYNLGSTVILGCDSRKESTKIKGLLTNGIKSVDKTCKIIPIGSITTPILHHCVYKYNNKIYMNYLDKYFHVDSLLLMKGLVIDCANGMGAKLLRHFIDQCEIHHLNPLGNILINTSIENYNKLNNKCGSHYVLENNVLPDNYCDEYYDKLCASINADCSEVVFYYYINDKLYVLNGIHMLMLVVKYIVSVLNNNCIDEKINVKLISDVEISCDNLSDEKVYVNVLLCKSTREMHKMAKNCDIGIYYTKSGYGTVLFNNDKCNSITGINKLKEICNDLCGDALTNLVLVTRILNKMNLTKETWFQMLT